MPVIHRQGFVSREVFSAPLLAGFWTAPAVASIPAPSPPVHNIDWRTSPLCLNLRGLNGARLCFRCLPGKPARGQVVGSGPPTDGSSICSAAALARAIHAASGGLVTLELRPGEAHYPAPLSHFVESVAYDQFGAAASSSSLRTRTKCRNLEGAPAPARSLINPQEIR
jgi:hypothetical protein